MTRDHEIGVDLEYQRPLDDADLIATQFFSLTERASLQAVPYREKAVAFYRCWSRKEAIIKALGLGLSLPLDCFDVTLTPDVPAQVLALRHPLATAGPWTLYDLPPLVHFSCALAVPGTVTAIETYRWSPDVRTS